MKLHVRPAFWLDVERHQVWLIKNVGAEIADKWFEAVWDTAQFLRANPKLGRVRRDLRHPGVRTWLVAGFNRWTIYYGLRDDVLVLYRLEGGERNLRALVIG